MAGAVSLNDVAKMLSTKGGDISTIGGAIGCMTAMISADAREKENTVANDVKKIKEFVCGAGGDLSSMFETLRQEVEGQTVEMQKLFEGRKDRKLGKSDIKDIVKDATTGLEKRLDKIVDQLRVIMKSQGGRVKWGDTKKTKDSVERFKDALNDKKKSANSKIAKLVEMLTELKAISLKDLLTFKPKLKLIDKLTPQINEMAKNIKAKDLEKVRSFIKELPSMLTDMIKAVKLSKLIKPKSLERLRDLMGFGRRPADNTILGIVNSFLKLDKNKLKKAKENMDAVLGVIKGLCLGVTALVVFSPVIIAAGLLSKPLTWALFGFKGNGGVFGIFKKLSQKSRTIKKANKSIMWMSLGLAALGAGLWTFFKLTKSVNLDQLLDVAVSVVALAGMTVYFGKRKTQRDIENGVKTLAVFSIGLIALGAGLGMLFGLTKSIDLGSIVAVGLATVVMAKITESVGKKKRGIEKGAEALWILGTGLVGIGVGLGVLFTLTRKVDIGQVLVVTAAIATLGVTTYLLGKANEKEGITKGAEAMVIMSVGLAGLGIGLGLFSLFTKNVDIVQMGLVCATIAGLGLTTYLLGKANKKDGITKGAEAMLIMSVGLAGLGVGLGILFALTKGIDIEQAVMVAGTTALLGGITLLLGKMNKSGMIYKGAIAMAVMGAALIPLGISLKLIMGSVRGLKWSEFGMFASSIGILGGAVLGLGALMATGVGAIVWAAGLGAITGLGLALLPLASAMKKLAKVSKDIKVKDVENIIEVSKKLVKELSKAGTRKQRKEAIKNAEVLEEIGKSLGRLSKSITKFNSVSDTVIDKMMDSLIRITEFFFGRDGISKYSINWWKRKKAVKAADTIGTIADTLKSVSKSLKRFNDVGDKSIDKMMDSITRIVEFFFGEDGISKYSVGWWKRRKAKRDADAIGLIADSLKSVSKSLKRFNDVGDTAVDKMMNSVERIAQFFFSDKSGISQYSIGWWKRRKANKASDAIGTIAGNLKSISKSLKTFNDVGDKAIDTMMNSVERIAQFFFGEDGISQYSMGWWKRRKAVKEADAIGTIAKNLKDISGSLKTFNEVGDKSIDTMMNSVGRIAKFFFSDEDGSMPKYSTTWWKRRKATKEADAIGTIAGNLKDISESLKAFNDVSDKSIDKMMDSVRKMAEFFFGETSESGEKTLASYSIGWKKLIKSGVAANTIGMISGTLSATAESLKIFNEVADTSIEKVMTTLTSLAEFFFDKEKGLPKYSIGFGQMIKSMVQANALGTISGTLSGVSESLKIFNEVTDEAMKRAMDTLTNLAIFFFDKDNGLPKYSIGWWGIVKSMVQANAIGTISESMKNIADSLKTFNEVAPESMEKAKTALMDIATFFFDENSGLNSLNVGWLKRIKAQANANTIGVISDSMYKISQGLKTFNEVAESSIEKAKTAITDIATFFFDENSGLNSLNAGWLKRVKAEKSANTIGVISDSMYKLSTSLKDFNQMGPEAAKTAISSIDEISKYFFDKSIGEDLLNIGKGYLIEKSIDKIGDAISGFGEKTKSVDVKKMEECINISNKISSEIFANWKSDYLKNARQFKRSMNLLTSSFDSAGRKYYKGVRVTGKLIDKLSKPGFSKAGDTLNSASAFIKDLQAVDIEKASALTDMFKSFASIGKGGGIFTNFDKRVKQFTEACVELVNAINGNTEAINNSDEEVVVKNEYGEEETVKRKDAELMPKQMTVLNVNELAQAIADQLNSMNIDCDTNINLQINGESGNEWRISRM